MSDKNSMAVFLALAFVILQIVAIPSFGDAGQLLSYSELMRLPHDQRAAYIDGVRTVLVELSKDPNAKFSDVDSSGRSRLKVWLEFVDSQVGPANAIEPEVPEVPEEPEERELSSKSCAENRECEAALRDCFLNKNSLVKWNSTTSKYECDSSKPIRARRAASAFGNPDEVLSRISREPDPQFSSEATPVIRLGKPKPMADLEVIQLQPRPDPNRMLFGASRKPIDSIADYSQEAARGRVSGVKCRSKFLPQASTSDSESWLALANCTELQELKLQEKFEAQRSTVSRAISGERSEMEKINSEVASAVPSALSDTTPKPLVVIQEPEVRKVNLKPETCAPKPMTCESREAIRKLYYQGNLPCIFAGMVSKLGNGNRRCQAVTDYKIGDKTMKCESGQTMCNPLLFGTVLGGSSGGGSGSRSETPICVGRGQNVTQQCGKISNARDAERFLNRNISGLQEKWDEFKRGLDSTCQAGSVSAKFHCHECNLMQRRLFELHSRLVKAPCDIDIDDAVRGRIKDRSVPIAR